MTDERVAVSLRRIIGLWDSLDAVGSDEPAEPYKEQMDAAVNNARKVLEDAYREAAADPDYRKDSDDLNAPRSPHSEPPSGTIVRAGVREPYPAEPPIDHEAATRAAGLIVRNQTMWYRAAALEVATAYLALRAAHNDKGEG